TRRVETVLLEQFKVPRAELGQSLAQFYRVPFVEYDSRIVPPQDLMKDLKLEFLKRNVWLPIRKEGNAIIVLIDNPQDLQRGDALYQLLRGQNIQLAVGFRKDIMTFLTAAGGEVQSKDSIGSIITALGEEALLEKEDPGETGIDENDSAVIRLANQIIIDAYKARASDIHVEPYGMQKDTMIRLRIDGQCREYQRIPGAYRRALAARLKIMAQLDTAERRTPPGGKIRFRLPDGRDLELRVATVPTQGGHESVRIT